MRHAVLIALACLVAAPISAQEILTPDYYELLLEGIYPAGGQRGQTVSVELWGPKGDNKGKAIGGLAGARDLIIDGPPGITVREVTTLSPTRVKAVLEIAPDAAPGRRLVRVKTDRVGATRGGWFVVGSLPEIAEAKANNEPAEAPLAQLPVVVNGRIEQPQDVDCVRFAAKAGQQIVAAIDAHGLDHHSRQRGMNGFIDASLELLGPDGSVLADAQDTVGLDPVLSFTIPKDGEYAVRVFLVGYLGCPEAVYRLTLGDVPYPVAAFPPGGKRGESVDLAVFGPGVPAGMKFPLVFPNDPRPMIWVVPPGMHHEVPLVLGDRAEQIESEPNDERIAAGPLLLEGTTNGRFDQAGDEDWYAIELAAKQRVRLDVVAQRYLREGIDTLLEVYDAKGERLAGNDDLKLTDVEILHDFEPFDSGLTFDAPAKGRYYVRLAEQSAAHGPRAAYRLTAFEPKPEFALHQWPDAAPVWGPGSTAAFLVTVDRQAVVGAADIELSVEGLPSGWTGSKSVSLGTKPGQPPHNFGRRVFLTITAPPDAAVGAIAPFHVVGRVTVAGQLVERIAQPLTTYITTDRTYCRWSYQSRAIVALPQGPHLETPITTLTVEQGKKAELPVRLVGEGVVDGPWPLIGNLATNSFRSSLGVAQPATFSGGQAVFQLATETLPPGVHSVVVSRAWRSEVRVGMPGPCTPIVRVEVLPK